MAGALMMLVFSASLEDVHSLWTDKYLRHIIGFTFYQAIISTFLTLMISLFIARALVRQPHWLHHSLLRFFFKYVFVLPVLMPSLMVILVLVTLYGQQGWVNDAFRVLGIESVQFLYGTSAIILAHCFMNIPLATRFYQHALQTIPTGQSLLAQQLGFNRYHLWQHLEWPAIKQNLPQACRLIFLMCFTSFTIVLALGGGPDRATLEVVIFQALRFDFDLPRAALLSFLQIILCSLWVYGTHRWQGSGVAWWVGADLGQNPPYQATRLSKIIDFMAIMVALIGIGLPLCSFLSLPFEAWQTSWWWQEPTLWRALFNSLLIALGAGLVATYLALNLGYWTQGWGSGLSRSLGWMVLVTPPFVIGTGLFLLLRNEINILQWGLVIVSFINGIMVFPFALALIQPQWQRQRSRHDILCQSLGISGWARFRHIEWPLLRRVVGYSFAICAGLSIGNYTVIAFFAQPGNPTLATLLFESMARNRQGEASAIALVMILLFIIFFGLFERGRHRHVTV